MPDLRLSDLEELAADFHVLIGLRVDWLSIPEQALAGFEPSQVAVIVNTLLDGALPQIELLASDDENRERLEHIGLSKAAGQIGEREGYPDYIHKGGKRIELKGLFVDNPALRLKRPPSRREASARLKQAVTTQEIDPGRDVLMVAAVQLGEVKGRCYPFIIDVGLYPMVECIKARDDRLVASGGRWLNGVPQVVKKGSQRKWRAGEPLTGADYETDTNFGKLKRIPYEPLQEFLRRHGAA
ncbi:MAG TPA: hypothetical protein VM075_00700 [Anaerolineae bacterium]|nr:hypothetical protein [Anaerolineae bacterium]